MPRVERKREGKGNMMTPWEFSETELWRYGENDVEIFHVFGSCAHKNRVFVFAEARYGDGSDAFCDHDIVMRRSFDGGRNFEKTVTLLKGNGRICYANGIPLFDPARERLFLFYSHNIENCRTDNFVMHSDDFGKSWSEPMSLHHCFSDLPVPLPFHLAGPGHGIVLRKEPYRGRLLMPFWHRREVSLPSAERGYCVSVLYSDDGGVNWKNSPYFARELCSNESIVTETKNGLLMLMRTRSAQPQIAESDDGGVTWHTVLPSRVPPARCCALGMISEFEDERIGDLVLISHVSDPEKRRDMEICISQDGGKTFPHRFPLKKGDAMPGYSDLSLILDRDEALPTVGLLHCRNNHVLFSRISLQTLTDGRLDGTSRRVWLK